MKFKNITKSIECLGSFQARNGSFPSYTSLHKDSLDGAYFCESVFSTALILSCLSGIKETDEIKKMKRKAVYFLLNQKTQHWTFNYWDRRSGDYSKMPYPDDLDDTSCALAALYLYNPKLIDGDVMAKFVTILTHLEIKEGGPYKSWITNKDAEKVWHDVDLAVNANIAFFLSLLDVRLDSSEELINHAIDSKKFESPYYTSEYPIIYFISRSYQGEGREKLINYILSKRNSDGNWGNPLFSALCVSALLNLGHQNKKDLGCAIDHMLKSENAGTWPFHTFYLGINPVGDSNKYHSGSSALTTAFCIEALVRFEELGKSDKKVEVVDDQRDFIREEVEKRTREIISHLDKVSQTGINEILARNLKSDEEQPIILLPYLFTKMLGAGDQVNVNQLIDLGALNLHGWMAYTVYDDILDGDGGVDQLSIANILGRQVYKKIIEITNNHPDFKQFFEKILDTIDRTNSWEVNNCRIEVKDDVVNLKNVRFPDFGDLSVLANRSLGHGIGPIAVLMMMGYCINSREVESLMKFFKHYIIARQLNDDAHDWEDDIRNGQLTVATKHVLKQVKNKNVNINKDMPMLQHIFWHETVEMTCLLAFEHAEKAGVYLKKISAIQDYSLLEKFLTRIKNASKKTLDEKKQTLEFLDTYKKLEDG